MRLRFIAEMAKSGSLRSGALQHNLHIFILTCCLIKSWVGQLFRPRATLGFYLCLAGQIHVKYAFSKLKLESSRAGCGPRAVFATSLFKAWINGTTNYLVRLLKK